MVGGDVWCMVMYGKWSMVNGVLKDNGCDKGVMGVTKK